MILLSILLYKSHTWGNSYSWIITRKASSQLDCNIPWSHIYPDGVTEWHWFLHVASQKREKKSTKFFISFGTQRLLKICCVTKNSIEWKIDWKEETSHAFLIQNISQQVFFSSDISVFIDQLEIYKDRWFSFFFTGWEILKESIKSIKEKWHFETQLELVQDENINDTFTFC